MIWGKKTGLLFPLLWIEMIKNFSGLDEKYPLNWDIIQTKIRNEIQIAMRNMIWCKKGGVLFALLRIELRKGRRWRPLWQMKPQHRIIVTFILIGIIIFLRPQHCIIVTFILIGIIIILSTLAFHHAHFCIKYCVNKACEALNHLEFSQFWQTCAGPTTFHNLTIFTISTKYYNYQVSQLQ